MTSEYGFPVDGVVAGLLAGVACGMGALPLLIKRLNIVKRVGLGLHPHPSRPDFA